MWFQSLLGPFQVVLIPECNRGTFVCHHFYFVNFDHFLFREEGHQVLPAKLNTLQKLHNFIWNDRKQTFLEKLLGKLKISSLNGSNFKGSCLEVGKAKIVSFCFVVSTSELDESSSVLSCIMKSISSIFKVTQLLSQTNHDRESAEAS